MLRYLTGEEEIAMAKVRARRPRPIVQETRTVTGWSHRCLECGIEFETIRPDALTCSPRCRTRRKRRMDKELAK